MSALCVLVHRPMPSSRSYGYAIYIRNECVRRRVAWVTGLHCEMYGFQEKFENVVSVPLVLPLAATPLEQWKRLCNRLLQSRIH